MEVSVLTTTSEVVDDRKRKKKEISIQCSLKKTIFALETYHYENKNNYYSILLGFYDNLVYEITGNHI